MPAFRGFFASLGASVSLAAAGALALLAISAVVALQGWPGLGGDAEGGTLALAAPRSEPVESADDGPVVLAAAADEDTSSPLAAPVAGDDPPTVADVPAPVADRGRSGPETVPDSGTFTEPETFSDPQPPIPAPNTPRPPDRSSPLLLDVEQPVRGLTGLTGDVLRTTGETLAPVTDPLLPGSGKAVGGLTDALGDTVESTGGALGATLGLLLRGR